MKVIVYHSSVIKIGGIETFLYNFFKRMHNKVNIVFVYKNADEEQIKRYSEYVKCVKFGNQQFDCDVVLLMSAWGASITQNVRSGKIIQMIHCNLEDYRKKNLFTLTPDVFVDQYVCVSEDVQSALKRLHNIDSEVIYNLLDNTMPIYKKPKNKKLTLITATRLSTEKGLERCIGFAKLIPYDYVWKIYGDTPDKKYRETLIELSKGTSIEWCGFKTPIQQEIAKADYLVQLSDTEGYCYSINEALYQRTPILVTPFNSAFEQVTEGESGYFIGFELEGIDFDRIKNGIPKIVNHQEKSSEQDWFNVFESETVNPQQVLIRSNKVYFDTVNNKRHSRGMVFQTDIKRARELIKANACELIGYK